MVWQMPWFEVACLAFRVKASTTGKVAERGDALSQRDGNRTEMGEIVCFDSNCLLHFLAVTLDLYFPIIYLLALLVFFLCMSFLHGVFCPSQHLCNRADITRC